MLQIHILGQFDVRADGQRIAIATRPAQSLFAFLVLNAGNEYRREKLAGLIWPETPEENARKNLRQELWRIRKALSLPTTPAGEFLLSEGLTVTFNRDADYWLDAAQLQKPVAGETALSELLNQLTLYHGELLPGFYDEWIVLERERLQAVFESKMEQLLERLTAEERWAATQEWAEKWLAFGGAPEPAYRALMLAYGARGDMAKVATIYQRCKDELQAQLGVEPSAETRALYEGLRKGARLPLRTATVQPSGTITFLFTDIEGSTRLLDRLGEQFATVLEDHRDILRAAFNKWNGREGDAQGDAFSVSFARAMDAVQCAVEAQRALAAHQWPQGESVRVRMGLHTGEPLVASTGYLGMDVHRAARIGDAAHGGQVLLSKTTRELVIHELPPGVTIRDLGEHSLKDMKYPTPLYQLVIEGLRNEFPPLRTKFTGIEAPTPGEPPFKGLQYFDEGDADLFFGREELTAKLVARLRDSQFLSVIIGASGSGKSSLVRAGFVPALKRLGTLGVERHDEERRVFVITPTAHPLEALASALTRDSESVTAGATLLDDLAREPRALHLFLNRRITGSQPVEGANGDHQTLLVIDQFEELFTLCRDELEREQFIDNLLNAITSDASPSPTPPLTPSPRHSLTLVLTLRADFYAHLAQYPELRDAVARQQEYIGPMTTEELRRAIQEPAARGHWEFEPGLVDLVLRDVGDEPGALPLLSHALLETWKRRSGHTLTLKGYSEAGGVRGAIAHTADTTYQQLSPEQQQIARNIFLRLTELGEGTEDTRRRATIHELIPRPEDVANVQAVLNHLAAARLITLGQDTAEVAHEALIREWSTLREWLNQGREGLRLQRHLTEAAQEWELLERDAGALYRGVRLAQAREWAMLNPNALNEQERAFLRESEQQEQREHREKEDQKQHELEAAQKLAQEQKQRAEETSRANRTLRQRAYFLASAFVLAIVLAGLALFLGEQSNQNAVAADQNAQTASHAQATAVANADLAQKSKVDADTQRDAAQKAEANAVAQQRLATARELAGSAINNLDVDPERSILLAMQAVTTTFAVDGMTTKEAAEALHRAVQNSRLRLTLHPNTGDNATLAFSPDGKRFVTGGENGQIKVWDLDSGKELFTLSANDKQVASVAFSPDGKRLASSSTDGTARVWDIDTHQPILDLSGHKGAVNSIAFSPDGKLLVTGGEDQTAKIWDAATGKELLTLTGHTGQVWGAQFSPDETRIATSSEDVTVRVWDAKSGKELFNISDFPYQVSGVTYSPDGKTLATDGDQHPALWDAETGKLRFILPGWNALSVPGPAFTPDGKYVAVASDGDGKVTLWDAATGEQYLSFVSGSPVDGAIAFSPECVAPPVAPYPRCGVYLATSNRDGTIKFWDTTPTGNREVLTVPGFAHCVSPDGKVLFTAADNGSHEVQVQSWRLPEVTTLSEPHGALSQPGQELFSYPAGHEGANQAAFFSRDCSRSAVLDYPNQVARITATASGKELLKFALPEMGELPGPGDTAFSPDGSRLGTPGPDNTAIVWDLTNGGKELLTLKGHTAKVNSVIFSPDGKSIATASSDMTAKVWDAATGKELLTLTGHTFWVGRVFFNPDGTRLATGSLDRTAKIWDLASGKELFTLTGPTASIHPIAFSPDGKWIATGSNDDTLRLWDAKSGKLLWTLPIPFPSFLVSFTPDGTRLVAGTDENRVYLPRIGDLFSLARTRVSRSLTTDECQQYLHVEQCPPTP